MSIIKARTLSGFQDLLPEQALRKTNLIDKLKEVFSSFGFAPIETPHLEYTEVLIGQTEGDIGKQLYRFKDNGDRDICLRFDLTVPFARYLVQHKNELGLPFKRYAVGNNFRGERPQQGRFREFTQCDFDIVGISSVCADAETIQIIVAGFKKLGFENFTVKISNRKLLNGLSKELNLEDKSADLIRIIDKKDKLSEDKFIELFKTELNCTDNQIQEILKFINLADSSNETTIKNLVSYTDKNEYFKDGAKELTELYNIISNIEDIDKYVKIDLSLARGLGYYTGHIFETVLDDALEVGSVCGGGRYDNLTQTFEKDLTPGVGASFGISRILTALEKLDPEISATPAKVLITLFDMESAREIHKIASNLRKENINTEVYPDPVKLKKQFQYANKKGFNYVLIIGSEELKNGEYTLKDLNSGKEQKIASFNDLISALR